MAFIKIKDKKNVEAIINTDMICMISKERNEYIMLLSSGFSDCYYHSEIKKIFDAIGESLD